MSNEPNFGLLSIIAMPPGLTITKFTSRMVTEFKVSSSDLHLVTPFAFRNSLFVREAFKAYEPITVLNNAAHACAVRTAHLTVVFMPNKFCAQHGIEFFACDLVPTFRTRTISSVVSLHIDGSTTLSWAREFQIPSIKVANATGYIPQNVCLFNQLSRFKAATRAGRENRALGLVCFDLIPKLIELDP